MSMTKFSISKNFNDTEKKERISLIKTLNETLLGYSNISILTSAFATSKICKISIREAIEAEKRALEKLTKFPGQFQVEGSKGNQ